ncbi:Gfo/Idh/MocA family protein [Fictibacillus fluitans]|uniref:Gfo/Idh/MocA family oxidoreductase n=1 Tax=Fictibacillus fluitans TaxID=3058422 RepID=A0ABT8HX23_9BACL|nr:Gfo/Idh/MocA family oxidoreductase [Fictibacillus sp. NE201]MDN4525035.1 Gfo/Idh/MocA family oxidoreductase [Fictibacillus sp. NE201]
MKKVRWGVLSTATIGLNQGIPAIQRSENAELVALASRGEKGRAKAEELSIPKYYDSYEKLLADPGIESVYIPLPNHLHLEWAVKAARQGKHVLCEKPAFLHAEDTKKMVEACREHGVYFMEAFMYQFHPQHDRVKEIIDSGEIGEVKLMRSSFSFYIQDRVENIRLSKEKGGGSIYDVGCYSIHAARSILQSEPIEVQAFSDLDPDTGVDLSSIVHMKLENGIPVVFDCSFDMANREEYEVVGTQGTITVNRAFRPDVYGGEGLILIQTKEGQREEKVTGDQYRSQIEHFSSCILEGKEPSYTLEETYQNMQAIDACYESIAKRQLVSL